MSHAMFSPALTVNLLRDLRRANTESAKKERIIQYVTATFVNDDAAQQLISNHNPWCRAHDFQHP